MQKQEIEKYIREGKSVDRIRQIFKNRGIILTSKEIRKIRDNCAHTDKNIKENILKNRKLAENLLLSGYTENEVYNFLQGEISLNKIKEISKTEQELDK